MTQQVEEEDLWSKWKHYPNSPFGNVDICLHGCVRFHGSKEKVCVFCDYKSRVQLQFCKECNVTTWHSIVDSGAKCLRESQHKSR